jgi:mannose-6-phosphate isomerase-like protein (cupin superfamily)
MKPVEILAALKGVPELKLSSATTAKDAEAAFPQLAVLNGSGVNVGRFQGQAPWERHAAAEELLHVLDGSMEITLLTDRDPVKATIRAGMVFVVPKGHWHKLYTASTVTLLSVTPKGTEVSGADDPRRGS